MRLDDILAVLRALEREGVAYAVFGALALAAHGLDRATRDLDLFVDPDPENVARLRAALSQVYDDDSIEQITAEDLGGEFPAIQYGPPDVDYTIDIVSRLGEAFRFEDPEIERITVGDTSVKVASPHAVPDEAGHDPREGPRRRGDSDAASTWRTDGGRAQVPTRGGHARTRARPDRARGAGVGVRAS